MRQSTIKMPDEFYIINKLQEAKKNPSDYDRLYAQASYEFINNLGACDPQTIKRITGYFTELLE